MPRKKMLLFFLAFIGIFGIQIASAEKIYISDQYDFYLYYTDIHKYKKIMEFPEGGYHYLAISNDGSKVYARGGKSIYVFDGVDDIYYQTITFDNYEEILRPVLSPDGKRLYIGSRKKNDSGQNYFILVLNTTNNEVIKEIPIPDLLWAIYDYQQITVSHDGGKIFVAPTETGKIYIYETTNFTLQSIFEPFENQHICAVSYAHDKNSLYVTSYTYEYPQPRYYFSKISIYNGNVLKQVELPTNTMRRIVVSPNNRKVTLLSSNRFLLFVDIDDFTFNDNYEYVAVNPLGASYTKDGSSVYIANFSKLVAYDPITTNLASGNIGSFAIDVAIAQDQFKDNTQSYSVPYNLLLDWDELRLNWWRQKSKKTN